MFRLRRGCIDEAAEAVRYEGDEMLSYVFEFDAETQKKVSKHATIAGLIFIILGFGGMLYPQIMSIVTVFFVGWLLTLGGFAAGYFTWMTAKNDWLGWLKAFVLMATGLFIIFLPLPGVAAVGLLLAFYFLLDAFSNAAIGLSMKPFKGWWVWLINAFFSLLLAVIFIIGWPFSAMWLVGFFVGISLFLDGFILLFMGSYLKSGTNHHSR